MRAGKTRADADSGSLSVRRALGTPLDWPEAKKNANHVREWGIEVRICFLDFCMTQVLMGSWSSNCWLFGIEQRGKKRMLCCGVMRLVQVNSRPRGMLIGF